MMCVLALMLGAIAAEAYPVSYTSCGIEHSVQKSPERVITMNQGATEMMLALGLADKMVGTAYLDDAIWPQYAHDYKNIKVLSPGYPNETIIMSVKPDFIVASYNSAFRAAYFNSRGQSRGIYNTTVEPCEGTGSEWEGARSTCRPQLHAKGIGTYLMADSCEDKTLRPTEVREESVYQEMRDLGSIFKLDVEPFITEMKEDFDNAAGMVATGNHGDKLKVVWVDCVGTCCQEPGQVFVGGGTGAPNMLMKESGVENVFGDMEGSWVCVNASDIVAADPDVLILADAVWDTADDKVKAIYSNSEMCKMKALKGARFVKIPFSASNLSPRNGPAALDLAISALHVRTGALTMARESGVSSFSPRYFEALIAGTVCKLYEQYQGGNLDYTVIATDGPTAAPTLMPTDTTTTAEVNVSGCVKGARWPWAFAWVLAWQFWM